LDSLISYILLSHDLKDPVSRVPYSDDDFRSINEKAAAVNLPIISPLAIANSYSSDEKSQKQLTRGLEAVLGELISELLTLIEGRMSHDHFNHQFAIISSEFVQPFLELKEIDLEHAFLALRSWESFLRGSPRRPTTSSHGRLQIVLHFLGTLWCPADQEAIDHLREFTSTRGIFRPMTDGSELLQRRI
jgi:hypothetical protein